MTSPGTRAFLAGLVDYAGLFPPAALAVEPALALYGRYRAGGDAWMLGRFLIPAARLAEADPFVAGLPGDEPVRFSVLGAPAPAVLVGPEPDTVAADPAVAWLVAAEVIVADARAFEARHAGRVVVDAFELRAPAALARDADALSRTLTALAPRLADGPGGPARVAVEIPFLSDPDAVEPAAYALAEANGRLRRAAFAAKLRCGGEGVPGVEALAEALTLVRRAGVAFKATAGLHHPIRHVVPGASDGAPDAHGFVNVFGGAVLAAVHDLPAHDLAEILDSRDAAEWQIGDALRWTSLAARPEQIEAARARVALAYGSCSFDEPTGDLRALGWLDPVEDE